MELGEKLKAARLEAGLSQRQLCGDTITRNMLSQIENGTAKPSFSTLQALCTRLGKPVSYFWEDAPSENLSLLHRAGQAEPKQALELLKGYSLPDPMLDRWYHTLSVQCCLLLAEQAVGEGRMQDARDVLQQAEAHGKHIPEFGEIYGRCLTLLRYKTEPKQAVALANMLPDNTPEQLLRARAALEQGDGEKCLACLACADLQTVEVLHLRSDALIQKKEYETAIQALLSIGENPGTYRRLELCYRELGNFERAYYYACKQR